MSWACPCTSALRQRRTSRIRRFKASALVLDQFAAARNVGGHQGAATGRYFQKRLWHAFAVGRQDADMRLRHHGSGIAAPALTTQSGEQMAADETNGSSGQDKGGFMEMALLL